MGALPKKKRTQSRRGARKSHVSLKAPTLTLCTQCGQKIPSHQVCSICGYYKGELIKETKVQEIV
ncbi:MAG: 50S ribosomal protein L32 [SAR202 cluster bacterium]|jgi:large subunit ribosomal protein L32|nr:50S ribosomal protein L32 [Chloroflexota bacterium]MCH2522563.1 50S ribosomal protein L32 [Dehalococcoidia bacterium]MQG85177.1 50S ribosomal protein L32 [SAR202 cluster bacterium]|tara:strand:- start:935 stop:1129 length:195 start_codon:yes stop_codon:yes gene_type:complete